VLDISDEDFTRMLRGNCCRGISAIGGTAHYAQATCPGNNRPRAYTKCDFDSLNVRGPSMRQQIPSFPSLLYSLDLSDNNSLLLAAKRNKWLCYGRGTARRACQ